MSKPKVERKRIGGVAHKRVPCRVCGAMIWVQWSVRAALAECLHHYGPIFPGSSLGLTRGPTGGCTHERQYSGDCSCTGEES